MLFLTSERVATIILRNMGLQKCSPHVNSSACLSEESAATAPGNVLPSWLIQRDWQVPDASPTFTSVTNSCQTNCCLSPCICSFYQAWLYPDCARGSGKPLFSCIFPSLQSPSVQTPCKCYHALTASSKVVYWHCFSLIIEEIKIYIKVNW